MPDADRTRMDPKLEKEQAEGDRKAIDEALGQEERTGETPRADIGVPDEQQGITNRPREEEEREQAQLPPRGEATKPTQRGTPEP